MPVQTRAAVVRAAIAAERAKLIFRFLDLPAELRFLVYEHLIEASTIKIDLDSFRNRVTNNNTPKGIVALFCVSKACNRELKALWSKFYATATFTFDNDLFSFARECRELCRTWKALPSHELLLKHQLMSSVRILNLTQPLELCFVRTPTLAYIETIVEYFSQLRQLQIKIAINGVSPCVDGSFGVHLPILAEDRGNGEPRQVWYGRQQFKTTRDCARYIETIWEHAMGKNFRLPRRFEVVRVIPKKRRTIMDETLYFDVEIHAYSLEELRSIREIAGEPLDS